MLLSNIEEIPGQRIVQFYGVVTGSTVRAKHIGRDIMAGLKNIFGGELKGYTELLQESREEALSRMVEQATAVGANEKASLRRPSKAETVALSRWPSSAACPSPTGCA